MPDGKYADQYTRLSKDGPEITLLGMGAWQWGDRFYWGFGRGYSETDVQAAFETSLAAGINWIDTAEIYGNGRSERIVGKLVRQSGQKLLVATKFMPFPWRLGKRAFFNALKASLERLQMEQVDLYQIHWPTPPFPVETWARALAEAVERGLIKCAGVSNYNASQVRRTHATLANYGIPLASNQVEYSLLARDIERNGTMATCRELGVTLIAYSPLRKGVLTGKYDPDHPLPGMRGRLYQRPYLHKVQPLIQRMREFGYEHGSKTPSQVALNWLICKGAVPIPGAKNARQANENAGALGWRLTAEEVNELDRLSSDLG